jgi:hypothetical protein
MGLHHLQQRHELESQLLEGAQWNAEIIESNYKANHIEIASLLAVQQDVETMLARHGAIKFAYRPRPQTTPGHSTHLDGLANRRLRHSPASGNHRFASRADQTSRPASASASGPTLLRRVYQIRSAPSSRLANRLSPASAA